MTPIPHPPELSFHYTYVEFAGSDIMIPAFYKRLLGRGFNTFSATAEIVVFLYIVLYIRIFYSLKASKENYMFIMS